METPEAWSETTRQKKNNEQNREAQFEDEKERYGFKVTLIEDSSIHVRDNLGNEVAFDFPVENIRFDEYDRFVEQMQNKALPLPSIENVRLAIHKPMADLSRDAPVRDSPNSKTHHLTWEEHAQEHGISADEMQAMYLFARKLLYARYQLRLRDEMR